MAWGLAQFLARVLAHVDEIAAFQDSMLFVWFLLQMMATSLLFLASGLGRESATDIDSTDNLLSTADPIQQQRYKPFFRVLSPTPTHALQASTTKKQQHNVDSITTGSTCFFVLFCFNLWRDQRYFYACCYYSWYDLRYCSPSPASFCSFNNGFSSFTSQDLTQNVCIHFKLLQPLKKTNIFLLVGIQVDANLLLWV